jgi:hemerythrin-like domain-containing protein
VAKRAAAKTRGRKTRAGATRAVVTRKAAKRKTAARAAASRSRSRNAAPKPSGLSAAATLVRGAAAGAAAAIASRLPWARHEHDPIVLLETDHRRFEELLKQGEETTERAVKRRTELLKTLTASLNVHELIEEKILYPALKPHPQAREIVLEGYQEHHVADLVLKELNALARDNEKWGAKFKVLKENIAHHIKEEEREMFRIARAVLSRDELNDLGVRMKTLKTELEN